ncbi:response regulator [Spirosoma fluviale]|uniref:CheY chemotaxis protein or a CheY-like REC (Receiver) domain n=1 Tax=Spirosoma fluviale TaxID=1597977 RepID=A0A286G6L7_9BACT|nr:response regulator [Spirosoma fluviale]SOD90614.1 CheY chemotaxis protein or a CheY-like REC (receiver) domain [Spirosoma fluviale]
MASDNESNTDEDQTTLQNFESWLALYRSRVYETYLSRSTPEPQPDTPQGLTKTKPNKPTILVIEDNADEWFLIRWALLQQFPVSQVIWIAESSRVMPYLNKCVQREIDLPRLILVDLYLPTPQSGLNTLKKIKQHPTYGKIPTVIVSRSNNPEDIRSAFTYSSNSYIVKPFTYNEWRERFSMLRTYWTE